MNRTHKIALPIPMDKFILDPGNVFLVSIFSLRKQLFSLLAAPPHHAFKIRAYILQAAFDQKVQHSFTVVYIGISLSVRELIEPEKYNSAYDDEKSNNYGTWSKYISGKPVHIFPDNISAHKQKEGPFAVFQWIVADIFLMSVFCINRYSAGAAVHRILYYFSTLFSILWCILQITKNIIILNCIVSLGIKQPASILVNNVAYSFPFKGWYG